MQASPFSISAESDAKRDPSRVKARVQYHERAYLIPHIKALKTQQTNPKCSR